MRKLRNMKHIYCILLVLILNIQIFSNIAGYSNNDNIEKYTGPLKFIDQYNCTEVMNTNNNIIVWQNWEIEDNGTFYDIEIFMHDYELNKRIKITDDQQIQSGPIVNDNLIAYVNLGYDFLNYYKYNNTIDYFNYATSEYGSIEREDGINNLVDIWDNKILFYSELINDSIEVNIYNTNSKELKTIISSNSSKDAFIPVDMWQDKIVLLKNGPLNPYNVVLEQLYYYNLSNGRLVQVTYNYSSIWQAKLYDNNICWTVSSGKYDLVYLKNIVTNETIQIYNGTEWAGNIFIDDEKLIFRRYTYIGYFKNINYIIYYNLTNGESYYVSVLDTFSIIDMCSEYIYCTTRVENETAFFLYDLSYDFDNDGFQDYIDEDDDNDNWNDSMEARYQTNVRDPLSYPSDLDNDFIPDESDEDIDGDGIKNWRDEFPLDPNNDNNLGEKETNNITLSFWSLILLLGILIGIILYILKVRHNR